jgi:hypothetical protein
MRCFEIASEEKREDGDLLDSGKLPCGLGFGIGYELFHLWDFEDQILDRLGIRREEFRQLVCIGIEIQGVARWYYRDGEKLVAVASCDDFHDDEDVFRRVSKLFYDFEDAFPYFYSEVPKKKDSSVKFMS